MLKRKNLEKLPCPQCGGDQSECGHTEQTTLSSKCHPDQGIRVTYKRDENAIVLWCSLCGAVVEKIVVADGEGTAER